MCAAMCDYSPEIVNVVDKPTGVDRRVADIMRMRSFGIRLEIELPVGLKRVINFIREQEAAGAEDVQGR